MGLDGHQAAVHHLPDLIPPEPPVRVPDGHADGGELDLHPQLLEDGVDVGVVGGVAVVKGDDDGLFRQGRAVLHVVDDLGEEHRVEPGVLQLLHLLFKDLRRLGVAPAQIGHVVVHQHRHLDRFAGGTGGLGDTAGDQLRRGGPGEPLVRPEGPVRVSVHDPQGGGRPHVGQTLRRDVRLIPEGQRRPPAHGLRVEGLNQQLGGELPGDGGGAAAQLLRLEPAEIGAVGHGRVRPVGAALELAVVQAVRPADHGEEGLDADGVLGAEAAVSVALDQPPAHGVVDIGIGPVGLGHIREVRRVGDGDAGQGQQQRQRQRQNTSVNPVKQWDQPPIRPKDLC